MAKDKDTDLNIDPTTGQPYKRTDGKDPPHYTNQPNEPTARSDGAPTIGKGDVTLSSSASVLVGYLSGMKDSISAVWRGGPAEGQPTMEQRVVWANDHKLDYDNILKANGGKKPADLNQQMYDKGWVWDGKWNTWRPVNTIPEMPASPKDPTKGATGGSTGEPFKLDWQAPFEKGFGEGNVTFRERANAAADHLEKNSKKTNTQKTPEELRNEYFQRLADIENNRTAFTSGGGRYGLTAVTNQTDARTYQNPAMEFEDMRQQLLNRARRGDKLAYNELNRIKEANDVLYKIYGGGELDMNDLEKLVNIDVEKLRDLGNVNREQLRARLQTIDSKAEMREMFDKAAAEMRINRDQLATILEIMGDGDWRIGAMMAQRIGFADPGLWNALLGEFANGTAFSGAYARYKGTQAGQHAYVGVGSGGTYGSKTTASPTATSGGK